MLFCDIAHTGPDAFDTLAACAGALDRAGYAARISSILLPDGLPHGTLFDLAPYLTHDGPGPDDTLLILGAHHPADKRLAEFRRLNAGVSFQLGAYGDLADRQAELGLSARLGYVFGRDPALVHAPQSGLLRHHDAPVFGNDHGPRRTEGALRLLSVSPDLENPAVCRGLLTLAASPAFQLSILTHAKAKEQWQAAYGTAVPVYHLSEVMPAVLASGCDLAIFHTPLGSSYRMRLLLADLVLSGAGLLDASEGFANRQSDPAFLPAPPDASTLYSFLRAEILPAREALGPLVRASALASQAAAGLEALGAELAKLRPNEKVPARVGAPVSQASAPSPERIIFVPTNGVGLGHAQRCSLIAGEVAATGNRPEFAAFPSCMRMLQSYGFDTMPLVSRSALHADPHANDQLNYLRLRRLSEGASALVFDGGHVFQSIYRTLADHGIPGVWIRRGLWQAGQQNLASLDREKYFARVIVPAEAFDELNESYSQGPKVHPVGPIVQRLNLPDREALREQLFARFLPGGRKIVVTMLGGGVAADRRPQIQAISSMLSGRAEVLHLVVVWPTARVDPGWFAWPNTRVVKTHHASALMLAADLYLSAAGYNSFHEAIYNGVPSIFMPQMSAFMDDQRARARAAADRGLALMVEAHEMARLEIELRRCLEGDRCARLREALGNVRLPGPGTAAAATVIRGLLYPEPAPTAEFPSALLRSVA